MNVFHADKAMLNLGRENKDLNTRLAGENAQVGYNAAAPFEDSPTRRNYQTYPSDYFSGANAKIFFGDIWVDDIVTIQYSVKQDKEPIYGYASQTFDAIARGTILVQGSFTIAFKEMGYLNIVMHTLEKQRARALAGKSELEDTITKTLEAASNSQVAFDPALAQLEKKGDVVFSPTGQPEIIRQSQSIEDILMYKRYGNTVSSGLAKDLLLDDTGERDFEDFAEILEDTIWGDANGKPYSAEMQPVNFRRADEFDYTWNGNTDTGGVVVAKKTPKGDDYSETLNLLITFGDMNDFRAEHTMVALNDVHIVNTSMVVSPTGEPIGETYFFIARDVNKALSKAVLTSVNPVKYNVGVDDPDGFNLKEKQIKDIEDFIAKEDLVGLKITLKSLSKFLYTDVNTRAGKWILHDSYEDTLGESLQQLNNWDSKIDQLIRIIERNINTPGGKFQIGSNAGDTPNTKFSQWAMKVTVESKFNPKEPSEKFNIILDQQIPNTLTYRVINPSRNNFTSYSAFTRADLWKFEPAKVTTSADTDASSGDPEVFKDTTNQTAPELGQQLQEQEAKQADADTSLGKTPEERAKNLSVLAGEESKKKLASQVGPVSLQEQVAKNLDYGTKVASEQNKFRVITTEQPQTIQGNGFSVTISPETQEESKKVNGSDSSIPTNAKSAGVNRLIVTEGAKAHLERGSNLSQDLVFATTTGARVPYVFAPEAGTLGISENQKQTVFVSDPKVIGTSSVSYGIIYSHTESIKKVSPTSYSVVSQAPSSRVSSGETIGMQVADTGKTGQYAGKELALHAHSTGFLIVDGKTDYSSEANAKAQELARQAYARQQIFTEVKE